MDCNLFHQLVSSDVPFEQMTRGERASIKRHHGACPDCAAWLYRRVVMSSMLLDPERVAKNIMRGMIMSMRDDQDPEAR